MGKGKIKMRGKTVYIRRLLWMLRNHATLAACTQRGSSRWTGPKVERGNGGAESGGETWEGINLAWPSVTSNQA